MTDKPYTNVYERQLIEMYGTPQEDPDLEHLEGSDDEDAMVNNHADTVQGTDYVDYGATDRTHQVNHMIDERQTSIHAARELQRTLSASKDHVSRVIGASSEIRMTTIELSATEPIQLCTTNQWRSSVSIHVVPKVLAGVALFYAVGTDQGACRPFSTAVNDIPLGAALFMSVYTLPPVKFQTVRDLWIVADTANTLPLVCAVVEEFVA